MSYLSLKTNRIILVAIFTWILQSNAQIPSITSFTPVSAKPSDVVIITGTNFSSIANNNIVFFGNTRATVIAATTTSINAIVPIGATFGSITVLNSNSFLASVSNTKFNPTYSPAKTTFNSSDLGSSINLATANNPYSIATGDLDGDGKTDLAVANYASNSVSVFRNTTSISNTSVSSFAAKVDFSVGKGPAYVAIGDIDNDGKPELIVANFDTSNISILKNRATVGSITDSSFATKVDFTTGLKARSVALGDVDLDGKIDIIVANNGSNSISILKNIHADGAFSASSFASKVDFTTDFSPVKVTLGDIDGDGKLDIATANFTNSNTVSVLKNISTVGTVTTNSFASKIDFTVGSAPVYVAFADIDGDNKLDLVAANYNSNNVSILRNTTTSNTINSNSFAAGVILTTNFNPHLLTIGDFDGDSKPDLAVANYGSNNISVLKNNSNIGNISAASFNSKIDFAVNRNPASLAIGDFNGDSRPDLVVANYNSNNVTILSNTNTLLPILLSQFSVTKKQNTCLLTWKSYAEINAKEYKIEKSIDGITFYNIGSVKANGFPSFYEFNDDKISNSIKTIYYKLKLVDEDGSYNFSETKKLYIDETLLSKIVIYPNPIINNQINLHLNNIENGKYELIITNSLGQKIFNQTYNINNTTSILNLNTNKNFKAGMYTLQMINTSNRESNYTQTFLVNK